MAQAAALARKGPSAKPKVAATSDARMPTCWPESERIWAQPALAKSADKPGSRSSRTPTISASSKGPALPPVLDRPASIAALIFDLRRSIRRAGAEVVMPAGSANAKRGARAEDQARRVSAVFPMPRAGRSPREGVASSREPCRKSPPSTATTSDSPLETPAAPPPLSRTSTVRRPDALALPPSVRYAVSSSRSKARRPEAVRLGSDDTVPA